MINVPVYSNENGIHFINIYIEDEDGTFRRTQDEPLRLLRDDIQGISPVQGSMVSQKYERQERQWSEPTVNYHYGRPQSFHNFLRQTLSKNKFYVFSKPSLSGRLSKFDLHELKLKTSISQRKISLLKEKYSISTGLWSNAEYEKKKQLAAQMEGVELRGNNKILHGDESIGSEAKNSDPGFRLDRSGFSANGLSNEKLDVEVADFMVTARPFNARNSPDQQLKDKRNAHFLLRFLFDRA